MGLYSTTIRIHSDKPAPLPTATRKNQTLLMVVTKWLDQALGGLAKAQGFDVLVNASGAARAGQYVNFAACVNGDPAGVNVPGGSIRITAAATAAASAALFVTAADAFDSFSGMSLPLEASATRGSLDLQSPSVGTTLGLGQWQFIGINGTPTAYGQFDRSDLNAAPAALAVAINKHPQCSNYFGAAVDPVTATKVNIWRFATPPGGSAGSRIVGATGKVVAVQLVAAGMALLRLKERTALGNQVTVTAVGDTTVGAATLAGGAGDDVAQFSGIP